MNLNVTQMPALETDEPSDFPQKDFRQDFMYAMVKYGLLDAEAPSRILGIQVEEIPALLDVKQIVEDAGDLMDEEGAVERVVGGLAGLDGNQGVVVLAILDVCPLRTDNIDAIACSIMGFRSRYPFTVNVICGINERFQSYRPDLSTYFYPEFY
jgi:hypothetical protein